MTTRKPLKAYTVVPPPSVHNDHVQTMLGQARHVRQVHIDIIAPSKAAAARLWNASDLRLYLHPRDFDDGGGIGVDALRAAGLTDEPAVFLSPLQVTYYGAAVVIVAERRPQICGRLYVQRGAYGYLFVPVTEGPAEDRELNDKTRAALDGRHTPGSDHA